MYINKKIKIIYEEHKAIDAAKNILALFIKNIYIYKVHDVKSSYKNATAQD
jgi:hypothetical protein